MLKIYITILLLFYLTLFIQNNISAEETEYNKYENPFLDVYIEYPQQWVKSEQFLDGIFKVSFLSVPENNVNDFLEVVELTIEDLRNYTSNEYMQSSKETREQFLENVSILEVSNVTLSNLPAIETIFTYDHQFINNNTIDEVYLKTKQITTITNDRAYTISFTSTTKDFEKYSPIVEKSFNSFKIK